MDGITVAKSCVAFLVSVLVLALLVVAVLAILTDRFETSRKSKFTAAQTPIAVTLSTV
jgi:flagellar biogenesis protein FliO